MIKTSEFIIRTRWYRRAIEIVLTTEFHCSFKFIIICNFLFFLRIEKYRIEHYSDLKITIISEQWKDQESENIKWRQVLTCIAYIDSAHKVNNQYRSDLCLLSIDICLIKVQPSYLIHTGDIEVYYLPLPQVVCYKTILLTSRHGSTGPFWDALIDYCYIVTTAITQIK